MPSLPAESLPLSQTNKMKPPRFLVQPSQRVVKDIQCHSPLSQTIKLRTQNSACLYASLTVPQVNQLTNCNGNHGCTALSDRLCRCSGEITSELSRKIRAVQVLDPNLTPPQFLELLYVMLVAGTKVWLNCVVHDLILSLCQDICSSRFVAQMLQVTE